MRDKTIPCLDLASFSKSSQYTSERIPEPEINLKHFPSLWVRDAQFVYHIISPKLISEENSELSKEGVVCSPSEVHGGCEKPEIPISV